jgi:ribosomal protein S18 acetylase RimI-like enzyme
MALTIEPFEPSHLEAVVELALRAWAPVFESLRAAMDPEVFSAFYPDWRADQRDAVTKACTSPDHETWVAVQDGVVVGFVNTMLHPGTPMGEIHMVAVDPDHQRQGIGERLTDFAVERLRLAGAEVAMVETGGDPGHAPARRTYERAGFRLLPIARYFKKL